MKNNCLDKSETAQNQRVIKEDKEELPRNQNDIRDVVTEIYNLNSILKFKTILWCQRAIDML